MFHKRHESGIYQGNFDDNFEVYGLFIIFNTFSLSLDDLLHNDEK